MVHINNGGKKRKLNRRPKQTCDYKKGFCVKCSGMSDAERSNAINNNIKKFGWHLTGVGAGESSPNFMYSIGFSRRNLPEMIIFGLPMDYCATFLNKIGNEMRKGKRFESNISHFGYTEENHPFMFLDVPQNVAKRYMLDTKRSYLIFRTRQFVWTDTNGKYPWDENFDENYEGAQTILGKIPNI